jgi:hypothetical protein
MQVYIDERRWEKPGSSSFAEPESAAKFVPTRDLPFNGAPSPGRNEETVFNQLKAGFSRLKAENRTTDFSTSVLDYTNKLIGALPRTGSGSEPRSGGAVVRYGQPLPSEALRVSLSSICPLWPFC